MIELLANEHRVSRGFHSRSSRTNKRTSHEQIHVFYTVHIKNFVITVKQLVWLTDEAT